MFENFSFQAPYRYDLTTSQEDNLSPSSKETPNVLWASEDHSCLYASPSSSPRLTRPDLPALPQRRTLSISAHLESLHLLEPPGLYSDPPASVLHSADSIPRFVDLSAIPELKLSIRSQRQNMIHWQLEESQRMRLADLVEDMINNELDCSVRKSPPPFPHTVKKEQLSPAESAGAASGEFRKDASTATTTFPSHCHRGHSDGSIRKGWAVGASHHGMCGSCERSSVPHKKPRTRRSLVDLVDPERPTQTKTRRLKQLRKVNDQI